MIKTLEKATEIFFRKKLSKNKTLYKAAKFGAKWQAERSYSEEEVLNILIDFHFKTDIQHKYNPVCIANWFEQFKKK